MSRITLIPLIGLILCGVGGVALNVLHIALGRFLGIALLYLGGSVLLLNVCSFQMCAALFVCGIGVAVLLVTAGRESGSADSLERFRDRLVFRLLLAVSMAVLAYTAMDLLRVWIPVRGSILFVSVWIILMCLTSLAMDDELLYRCMYLQGICLAFTLSYIYIENSVLVFSCFAAINLLMAFGSSVLIIGQAPAAPSAVEDEQ